MKRPFVIYQEETGFVDGFYFDKSPQELKKIKAVWDERYPEHTHTIHQITPEGTPEGYRIRDESHLPTIYRNTLSF